VVSEASKLLTGSPISPLRSTSLVAAIISVVVIGGFGICWRWLWHRIPVLSRWFPDLTGRWEGTYLSSYRRADGEQATGPITVVIRQGLFETTVSAWTGEMNSHSTRSWHEADRPAQRFRLGYTYRSDPKAAFRDQSNPHEGVCWFDYLPDSDPERLRGLYYTERRTLGDLDLRRLELYH
jgi:hypothetical protein